MDKRTITVYSTVSDRYAPDTVEIDVRFEKKGEHTRELADCHRRALSDLTGDLASAGFEADVLRERSFRIDVWREYEDNKSVDKGYVLNGAYSLAFDMDNELFGKAVGVLGKYELTFSVQYVIGDESEYREELLRRVVEDSRDKAIVLARACDCTLGDVAEIKYTSSARHHAPVMMRAAANDCAAPQDIELSESAEIVWEIN